MKANAIIRIIIWSIVLVLLLGILTVFLAREQYQIHYVTATEVPTELVAATPVQALPNEDKLVVDRNNVDKLEIEWVAGDIIIQPRDVEEITISESDVRDEKYSMVWNMNEGTLELSFCEEYFMPGFVTDISKDLYIDIPLDWNCRSLEIDVAEATVEIRDMAIGDLDLDAASGTIRVENCDIRTLDIDTASGEVIFSGTLETLDFDAASANFTGEFYNTPARIDMDSMSGMLDITLPEDCGYALSMGGLDKSFRSDFQGTENRNGIHTYGDGHCRIKVDGMNCEVTIRKGERSVHETEAP